MWEIINTNLPIRTLNEGAGYMVAHTCSYFKNIYKSYLNCFVLQKGWQINP